MRPSVSRFLVCRPASVPGCPRTGPVRICTHLTQGGRCGRGVSRARGLARGGTRTPSLVIRSPVRAFSPLGAHSPRRPGRAAPPDGLACVPMSPRTRPAFQPGIWRMRAAACGDLSCAGCSLSLTGAASNRLPRCKNSTREASHPPASRTSSSRYATPSRWGSSIPGRQNWCWGIVVAVDMTGESHRGSG
jgi:hypothetical protein